MTPALYRGDLVSVSLPGGLGRPPESPGLAAQLAWVDGLELVEGRQVGAWVYPVYAGVLDRSQRYYFPRSRLTWTGLATERVPGRIRRAWMALARALALAQLPDSPDWGAEAATIEAVPGLDPWGRPWCYCLDAPQNRAHAHIPDSAGVVYPA